MSMWRYEIHDSEDRLVEVRRQYLTRSGAEEAGKYALTMIHQIVPDRTFKLTVHEDDLPV